MHFNIVQAATVTQALGHVLTPLLGDDGFEINDDMSIDVHCKIDPTILNEAIKSCGFELVLEDPPQFISFYKKFIKYLPALSMLMFVVTFVVDTQLRSLTEAIELSKEASIVLRILYSTSCLLSTIAQGHPLLHSITTCTLDLHYLVSVAVVGGLILQEFFDASLTSLIFVFATRIEESTIIKTKNAVADLISLIPTKALVVGELKPLPRIYKSRRKSSVYDDVPTLQKSYSSFELTRSPGMKENVLSTMTLPSKPKPTMKRQNVSKYFSSLDVIPEEDYIVKTSDLPEHTALEDNIPITVPSACLSVGTIVLVRKDGVIPVDGVVVDGESTVDESILSGDKTPIKKRLGGDVFAGTKNLTRPLKIRVSALSSESVLSNVIHSVVESSERRSRRAAWIKQFAKTYTPIVFVLGLLVAIIPPFTFRFFNISILDLSLEESFLRMLLILVAGCPYSLVLSYPIALFSASSLCSKNGLVINSGSALESAASTKVCVFDKNGSLTCPHAEIEHVVAFDDVIKGGILTPDDVLLLAGSLEGSCSHKFSVAITKEAMKRNKRLLDLGTELDESLGCEGILELDSDHPKFELFKEFNGKVIWSGSLPYSKIRVDQESHNYKILTTIARDFGRDEISPIAVGVDNQVIGVIGILDKIRQDSYQSVRQLIALKLEVAVISADVESDVQRVANILKIPHYFGELTMEEKVSQLKSLQERYGVTLAIGDAFHDSKLLAHADVSIALSSGSKFAEASADGILFSNKLQTLPWFVSLARRTVNIIRFNVFGSITFKVLKLILITSKGGTLTEVLVFDIIASLVVVLNSLRISTFKGPDFTDKCCV
ncbi:hypothetical protein GEMRC1_004011 [Eukaryota sp. GEM-RC1]